ncbi:membrane bound O-acyl transferase family-domain-containing protein [Daldinia sp. FL1419]|nr:membrane bound O-acyl transferase family-domain-containing protein [Daldinia sp. FL1419]
MDLSIPSSYESIKPESLLVISIIFTVLGLHFPSKLRPLFLPPTWLLAAWSFASVQDSTASKGLIGLESYTVMTSIIHMLILPRILYFESQSALPKASKSDKPTSLDSLNLSLSRSSMSAACWIWNNPRHLSRQRSEAGLAPWSEVLKFALFRILKIGIFIFIDRFLVQRLHGHVTSTTTILDFTPDQEPILRHLLEWDDDPISSRQLLLRAFVCVSWMWTNVLMLESYHAILSLLFVVVLRFDDPEDWPPLFGNPVEAWSVRRFWGRFWHRIASPTFDTYARIISQRILRLKPGSSADRAIAAFGIFFLSGLVHAITAWKVGQGELDIAWGMWIFGLTQMLACPLDE